MDVIEGVLADVEVIDMPTDTLRKFSKLFNVHMNKSIEDYMKSSDADPEAVGKLRECLLDSVTESTFHLKVRDKKIRDVIRSNRLQDLPGLAYNNELNLPAFIEGLEWLSDNVDKIHSTLPVRTKSSYDEAYEALSEYQRNSSARHVHNLPKILKANRNTLFCPMNEKPVNTGLLGLSLEKNRWRMQLKAAQYLKYCLDNGIDAVVAREC